MKRFSLFETLYGSNSLIESHQTGAEIKDINNYSHTFKKNKQTIKQKSKRKNIRLIQEERTPFIQKSDHRTEKDHNLAWIFNQNEKTKESICKQSNFLYWEI